MAFRFPARKLTRPLAGLFVAAILALPGCSDGQFLTWEPDTPAEKAMRERSEALQTTVGEASVTGIALGAVVGGLLGGTQGAFTGARLGQFVGAATGTYVRSLQASYADQEAQLAQVASEVAAANAELELSLTEMRAVLDERRAVLQSLKAEVAAGRGNAASLARQQARAKRALAEMNGAIDGANQRAAFFGEARTLVLTAASQAPAAEPVGPELAALTARIAAMREIAGSLSAEI